jgi:hypothetical protein
VRSGSQSSSTAERCSSLSLLVSGIGRYVAGSARLLADGVHGEDVLAVSSKSEPSVAFYGVLLASAVFFPQIAAFGLCVVSMLAIVLPARAYRLRGA